MEKMDSLRKNVVERSILKIETLRRAEPDYFTSLFTELMVLANYRAKGEKDSKKTEASKAIDRLERLFENVATIQSTGDAKVLNLGESQAYFNYLKGTPMGRHKIEKILVDLEVEMKLIYYDLTSDYDVDMIRKGVNLKKERVA